MGSVGLRRNGKVLCAVVACMLPILAQAAAGGPTSSSVGGTLVTALPPARPADLPRSEDGPAAAPKSHKPATLRPPRDASVAHAGRASDGTGDGELETPVDVGRPDRPGSFGNQPVRVPGPFLKGKTVAPHSKRPDLELSNDGRTTVGVFGNAELMDRTDLRNSTSKSVRDVGAGLTLQYRFGQ